MLIHICIFKFIHSHLYIGIEEYKKRLEKLTPEYFLELMNMDKKVADGELSLVLLEGALGSSTVRVCVYVCVCICMYFHMCNYLYIYSNYIYTYMYIYFYICIYIFIYI
jgi:hypothetical protein